MRVTYLTPKATVPRVYIYTKLIAFVAGMLRSSIKHKTMNLLSLNLISIFHIRGDEWTFLYTNYRTLEVVENDKF